MQLIPIRYVRDVDASRRFYEALGLATESTTRAAAGKSPGWVELRGTGGVLALHYLTADAPPSGAELAFASTEPLEAVAERLHAAGYELASAIVDEAFGRSFTVDDPEGYRIQVSEYDRALYT